MAFCFSGRKPVNESATPQTETEVRTRFEPPTESADPDDPDACELDADDRTPEEAGYGYGV